MTVIAMSKVDFIEHVARISEGKDSLKMLDVIITRGLQLDRVTTTDVWATDTVRAELPEVLQAKERIEEKLWQMYRITVDHLCARNPDGTKRTYEQMFYHIPNRRSQDVQVEREKERDGLRPGSIRGFPDLWNKWCQSDLKRNARLSSARINHRIPTQHKIQLVSKAQNCTGLRSRDPRCATEMSLGVNNSKFEQKLSFLNALPRGAGKEGSWNTSALQLMNRTDLAS